MGERPALSHVGQRPSVDLRSKQIYGYDRRAALGNDAQPIPEGVCRVRVLRHGNGFGWNGIQLYAPRLRQAGHGSCVLRLLRGRPYDLYSAISAQRAEARHREIRPRQSRSRAGWGFIARITVERIFRSAFMVAVINRALVRCTDYTSIEWDCRPVQEGVLYRAFLRDRLACGGQNQCR